MFFDDDEIDGYGEENRLVQSTKGEYDIEENVLRPKTLEAYVGQSKVKENLKVYMNAAKQRTSFYTERRGWAKLRLRTLFQTKWADSLK